MSSKSEVAEFDVIDPFDETSKGVTFVRRVNSGLAILGAIVVVKAAYKGATKLALRYLPQSN